MSFVTFSTIKISILLLITWSINANPFINTLSCASLSIGSILINKADSINTTDDVASEASSLYKRIGYCALVGGAVGLNISTKESDTNFAYMCSSLALSEVAWSIWTGKSPDIDTVLAKFLITSASQYIPRALNKNS